MTTVFYNFVSLVRLCVSKTSSLLQVSATWTFPPFTRLIAQVKSPREKLLKMHEPEIFEKLNKPIRGGTAKGLKIYAANAPILQRNILLLRKDQRLNVIKTHFN